MRLHFLAAAIVTLSSAAAAEPPDARAAYVERRGLLEADARCDLLAANLRAALGVGAAQARGALLRAGWSSAQVRQLDDAVAAAAGARACTDARTRASAAQAEQAFAPWISAGALEFPGWRRGWTARRSTLDGGWRLSQAIDEPVAARFGVRERGGVQRLTLMLPLAPGEAAPEAARLILRDPARAAATEIALNRRIAEGLEAGLPAPGAAASFAAAAALEREDGRRHAVFTFPDAAFAGLLALDPRESVEIRLESGRRVRRLLIEVGDIAAARAFLAID